MDLLQYLSIPYIQMWINIPKKHGWYEIYYTVGILISVMKSVMAFTAISCLESSQHWPCMYIWIGGSGYLDQNNPHTTVVSSFFWAENTLKPNLGDSYPIFQGSIMVQLDVLFVPNCCEHEVRIYDEHVLYVLNAARINWRFPYLSETQKSCLGHWGLIFCIRSEGHAGECSCPCHIRINLVWRFTMSPIKQLGEK